MRFLYQPFEAKRKEIIEVEIDQSTKVKFMTAREFKSYKLGKTYSFHGGLFEESPVRFVVPFDSNWHAVVDHVARHDLHGLWRLTSELHSPP